MLYKHEYKKCAISLVKSMQSISAHNHSIGAREREQQVMTEDIQLKYFIGFVM